jgi:hypothetical protein
MTKSASCSLLHTTRFDRVRSCGCADVAHRLSQVWLRADGVPELPEQKVKNLMEELALHHQNLRDYLKRGLTISKRFSNCAKATNPLQTSLISWPHYAPRRLKIVFSGARPQPPLRMITLPWVQRTRPRLLPITATSTMRFGCASTVRR